MTIITFSLFQSAAAAVNGAAVATTSTTTKLMTCLRCRQSDQECGKFCHFCNILKVFDNFLGFNIYLAKLCINFGNFSADGRIGIAVPKWPNIEQII